MSVLEQPFIEAIAAKQIEGVILQAKSTTGTTYSKALGNRTPLDGTEKPLSTSDLIYLASATKPLTTIAALQCCEKGLLALDADLRPRLKGLCEKGVLIKYDKDDQEPIADEIKNPLTLRHLLTHSSGLVYEYFDPKIAHWHAANPLPKDKAHNVPERMTTPLAFQPGEGWLYGTGCDWAGYLVEEASEMKLDAYFRTRILQPLSIPSTDLSFFPIKEGLSDRMPDLNPKDPGGNGLMAGMGNSVHEEGNTHCFGGHGAYMSCEAFVEVLYSILSNDGVLLQPESVEEMFKPQLEPAAKQYLTSVLENPMSSFFGQNTSGSNRDFGLGGLRVGEDGDCGMGEGSLTWGGGINSAWVLDRKNGVCGIVSPQLGLPVNMQVATTLRGHFRSQLKGLL